MKSGDTHDDTHVDNDVPETATRTLSIEISEELYNRWEAAVRQKHGRYRGAKQSEAEAMINAWCDDILGDGGVTNRELLERLEELEQRIGESATPRPTHSEGASQTTKFDGSHEQATVDATEDGIGEEGERQEEPTVEELKRTHPVEFWEKYDPDVEYTEAVIGEDEIKALSEVDDEIEVDDDDIREDAMPYRNLSERIDLVAAVIRHNHSVIPEGDALDYLMDLHGYEEASRREHRRTKLPRLLDRFCGHPDVDSYWITREEVLDERDEWRVEEARDECVAAVSVIVAEHPEVASEGVRACAAVVDHWEEVREEVIEVIDPVSWKAVHEALVEMQEMEDWKVSADKWVPDGWIESADDLADWFNDDDEVQERIRRDMEPFFSKIQDGMST